MSIEVVLAVGYVLALLLGAFVLEWLSLHTQNRSQQFRTSGFDYDQAQDLWVCHQGNSSGRGSSTVSGDWCVTGPRQAPATPAR